MIKPKKEHRRHYHESTSSYDSSPWKATERRFLQKTEALRKAYQLRARVLFLPPRSKEVGCKLKRDEERLRNEIGYQKASAQRARATARTRSCFTAYTRLLERFPEPTMVPRSCGAHYVKPEPRGCGCGEYSVMLELSHASDGRPELGCALRDAGAAARV
jgi:hypothetical protein